MMLLSNVTGLIVAIIFISSFSMGIVQYLGIPLFVPKMIAEGLVIVLFMVTAISCLLKKDCKFNFFGLTPVGGVLAAGLMSASLNGASNMQLIIFVRGISIFYLLFLALINLRTPDRVITRLLLLLVILFSIQIPMSWLKLFFIGIDEKWIGTVHRNAGQLSLLLPMFASSFLFAFFLYTRKLTYLIWIALFFLFAIIGEKEAAPFLFPPLFIFILWYFYSIDITYDKWPFVYSIKRVFTIKNTTIILFTVTVALLLSIQLLPSLNPTKNIITSVNPINITKIITSYNMQRIDDPQWNYTKIKTDQGAQMGRMQVNIASFKRIVTDDVFSFLFGYGGGSTSISPWAGLGKDIMYKWYGIRGATPAMAQILLECGIVGVFCMFYLFFMFYRAIHLKLLKSNNPASKGMLLGLLGMHVTFIIDFTIYSQASFFYGVLTPVYFFMLALLIKDQLIPFSFSR